MSVCVSGLGEFGAHALNADHQCVRCGEFDFAALAGELGALRAVVDALRITLSAVDYITSPGLGASVVLLGPGADVIDYRALLIKYIDHVGQEEGTVFLTNWKRPPERFTDAEWSELGRLADEAAEPTSLHLS